MNGDEMPTRCTKCNGVIAARETHCWYPVESFKVPGGGVFHAACCPWHSGHDRRTA